MKPPRFHCRLFRPIQRKQQTPIKDYSGLHRGIFEFLGERLAALDNLIQRVAELFQPGNRHHDRILATADFLNNPEELAALIFAQVKRKTFALDPQSTSLLCTIH